MKYKVGDKVKAIKGTNGCDYIGHEGEIYLIDGDAIHLKGQFGEHPCHFLEGELELISTKTNLMTKLNSMMKRLLDADTKKLIKAGLIDGDLRLTAEGQEALSAILFDQNKAELVKVADEIIAEAKEDK